MLRVVAPPKPRLVYPMLARETRDNEAARLTYRRCFVKNCEVKKIDMNIAVTLRD
jgi:hypothetical protein